MPFSNQCNDPADRMSSVDMEWEKWEEELLIEPTTRDVKVWQMGNDIRWTCSVFPSTGIEELKWIGYDDSYFWATVATSDTFLIRQDSCGNRYQLDIQAGHVIELGQPTEEFDPFMDEVME